MSNQYTSRLRLVKQTTGENSGTWGTVQNEQMTDMTEDAISGYVTIALSSVDVTLSQANGTTDQARMAALELTGTLTGNVAVVIPSATKQYQVRNNTTGSFTVTMKCLGGGGSQLTQLGSIIVVCDGVSVRPAVDTAGLAFGANTFVDVSSAQTIIGSKTFTSVTTFTGSVCATSATTFTGNVCITSAVNVTGVLSVTGVSAAASNVFITGAVAVTGQVSATALLAAGVSVVTSAIETSYSRVQYFTPVTLTDAASVTWNLQTSPVAIWTLGGNRTVSCTNMRAGATYIIQLIQDGTGGRTVTWPSFVRWPASATPTLTTTSAKSDDVAFFCPDGAKLHGNAVLNFSA